MRQAPRILDVSGCLWMQRRVALFTLRSLRPQEKEPSAAYANYCDCRNPNPGRPVSSRSPAVESGRSSSTVKFFFFGTVVRDMIGRVAQRKSIFGINFV